MDENAVAVSRNYRMPEVVIFTQSEVYKELLWLYSVWLVSAAEVTSTVSYYSASCNPIRSPDGDCKWKVDVKQNDI